MKKILFLLVILFGVVGAKAQTALTPAIDTLTNTDTARLVVRVPGKVDVLSFQANYLKISGTSASSLLLQGSIDGVNYVTLPGADTATIEDKAETQAFLWTVQPSPYLWYRLYGVTTGTQSGQLKAWFIAR